MRHFKGIMEHYRTKDILYVMNVLDHKNTSVSMPLVDFKPDGYISRAAGMPKSDADL
ncbi:MAG: hypothetical protein ACETWE_07420 [Candidatus Bathyarchaeia archaeon]